ncbi:hypothetical protein NM688_g8712 [Phlebia brevispora]|uniref:Uncharacterized protein n=1 Tax=Phlebia brevispora TaxID=194682 RepID=A0ACC1RT39_9APHY|nr:hypothetical protein NM688_g8712 [Phlebia brevispora]
MLRNVRRNAALKADQYTPQADPWVTIENTLRGRDEDKVHDCKEDMDTLLVFAGLYSAVLTSFLVQSYQNLQENYQQTAVGLLRQLSSQTSSYRLNEGYLNSTASALPSQTPFQAEPTDVRVNVCWFASLILSLSTASFGILVKQWLREYLAIDRTVPEERIRTLHFRARGLEQWKLFKIAAALPLVLQLSLALFFVGLCYFTSEIHPSLRTTSLTLVSGWALLVVFTFLAPLVSARCPYKTTFLRSAYRHARTHIRNTLVTRIIPFVRWSSTALHERSLLAYKGVRQLCTDTTTRLHEAFEAFADVLRTSRNIGDKSIIGCLLTLPPRSVPPIVMHAFREHTLAEDATIVEEDAARTTEQNDLIIFRDVDSILRDDNLLLIMREALQRKPRSPEEILKFVASIVRGRLGIPQGHNVDSIDLLTRCRELAPRTSFALREILGDVLQRDDISFYVAHQMVPFLVLLTPEGIPVLEGRGALLHVPLSDPQLVSDSLIYPDKTTDDWQKHVFHTTKEVYKLLGPEALRRVVHNTYVDNNGQDLTLERNTYDRLLAQVGRSPGHFETWYPVPPNALRALVSLAMSIFQDIVDEMTTWSQLDESKVRYAKELLKFFFGTIPVLFKPVMPASTAWRTLRRDLIVNMMCSVFKKPLTLLPTLLECLDVHRGLLSELNSFGEAVLLNDAADVASQTLPAHGKTCALSSFATFLQAKRNLPFPLTVYKALLIYSICLRLCRGCKDHALHRRISSLMIEHLKKARCMPISSPSSLSSVDDLPREVDSVTSLAFGILSLIDADHQDGLPPADTPMSHHIVSPFDGPARDYVAMENAHYYRWRESFDVNDRLPLSLEYATTALRDHGRRAYRFGVSGA